MPNSRAIVLQQCGQCRWAGGMKRRLIRAQTTRCKILSCKGQVVVGVTVLAAKCRWGVCTHCPGGGGESQTYILNTRGGGRIKYRTLFIFIQFYEYSNLEYVHIHGIYRVAQAGYVIRILVAAPREYVNTYSTCRVSDG